MNTTEIVETKVESTAQELAQELAVAMRELADVELALVGGGTGAVIWA